jgi:hypothetical protein
MASQYRRFLFASTALVALSLPTLSLADGDDVTALKDEVQTLRSEMAEMRKLLKQQGLMLEQKAAPDVSKADVEKLQVKVKELASIAKEANEWQNTNSSVHLAGYASAGYTDQETVDGRFDQVQFSPIFHYQYKDLMLLESELEFKIKDDGTTDIGLEYLSLDLILNDYATLIAGKFLTPLGQFRQNLHPSWINKLPSAPSGFGHDGAAPSSEIGVQLRGAIPMGDSDMRANYAFYVGNGPELELDGDEIHAIETGGFPRDIDNNKVYGGRVGFIPIPKMELGLSAAMGGVGLANEDDRAYRVLGVDAAYQWKNLDLRGEYIQQKVGNLASSAAPGQWKWESWYVQGAYKLPRDFEAVARYTDFDSPHGNEDQKQWALGLNYLFAPQVVAKVAYEFNEGQAGSTSDADRIMAQITYGF